MPKLAAGGTVEPVKTDLPPSPRARDPIGPIPAAGRRGVAGDEPRAVMEQGARQALLAAVPSLRAFAMSLTGSVDRADDLVQDTILRAWTHFGQFQPGTNLNAWLFTILRNLFHSDFRKR